MQSFEHVQVRREGRVAVVTIDRAAKRNALNEQLLTELRQALEQEHENPQTAVLLLTGNGSVFSAGADRSSVDGLEGDALARAFASMAPRLAAMIGEVVLRLVSTPKLVVGAINGDAVGGAMILALGCDLRVISDTAKFWMPEMGMGRAVGEPSVETLVACVGPLVTKDIIISGRRVDAAEMLRLGLMNRSVPADEVMSNALEWAGRLAALSPHAINIIKSGANAGLLAIWERAARTERRTSPPA